MGVCECVHFTSVCTCECVHVCIRGRHHTPRATSQELEPETSRPDALVGVTFEGRVGWRQPWLS